MTEKITGVLVVVLIACSLMGLAVQYPLTVTDLEVEGNDEIRFKDILDTIHFNVGSSIEEADLREASQAIYDLGWFSEVTLDRNVLETGRVIFQVVENPVIRKIEISGNTHRRDFMFFGLKLFDEPIMPTYRIRSILWENDVRRRDVLNRDGLTDALDEILAKYRERGYLTVSVGNVEMGETLRIEFIEHVYAGSLIEGLVNVPVEMAEAMIEIPTGEPLRMSDLARTRMDLASSVFFSNVGFDYQEGLESDSLWLIWQLTERTLIDAPLSLQAINFAGNTVYSDAVLADLIPTLPEEPVGNYQLLQIIEGVYDRYIDSGYTMLRLAVAAIEDGVLTLELIEGAISEIVVEGNTKTRDYVISRNLDFAVGDVANRNDLLVTYQQLNSLGYFGALDLVPEWGEEGVVVTITIAEKKDMGGFGGSMVIDPSTGDLLGELSLNQKNLMGTGQDLELSYSRGLVGTDDIKPSTWNLGYSTVAYFPEFDRVGVDLFQTSRETTVDDEAAVSITVGGAISFSYPIAEYSNFGLAFRHEEERVNLEDHWTPSDVVTLSLTYNNANDPFFPTEGSRRQLKFEKAGGFSAGREYTKFDLTWIQYVPSPLPLLSSSMDQTLAIRVKAGWGDATVPLSKQMELGGSTSIRGIEGSPSRQYVLSNFEYRMELVDGLYATAFLDGGFDLSKVRMDDLLSSFGFELGINAAGLLVRLDFVWVLDEDFSWVPIFDFGMGSMF